MYGFHYCSFLYYQLIVNSLSIAQRGEKVAIVRGDLSASTKNYPVVVTTIQPTWSGHMRPKMVQNIWKYVKTWKPQVVDYKHKLATTWADIKIADQ